MPPHLHTDTNAYTQLKIEPIFKSSPVIVLVLILLKFNALLGDTEPCWSVCNWLPFLNISSSLLGLANHLFSLSVPAGPSYYEFLFLFFPAICSVIPKLTQKKQSGISDISIPKWTLSFSVLEALFSLHDLVTWLPFYCSHLVFWGLDLTGTGWHVLMGTTVAVFLQERLRILHEVL